MEMTDDLRKKLNAAKSVDEARRAIEEASRLLVDDDLEEVSGGVIKFGIATHKCPICKQTHDFETAYPWSVRVNGKYVTKATQYYSYTCIFVKYTQYGQDYYCDNSGNPLEM